jgi:2-keto-3-deoxy-L-rhamnonate aldolase RhmA
MQYFASGSARVPIGGIVVSPSAAIVEIMGHVGFDAVKLDQMYSAIGWEAMSHLIRAAKLFGMTPIVKIAADPWGGAADSRLSVEVARALGVGAEGVTASVAGAEDVRAMLRADTGAYHRGIHLFAGASGAEDAPAPLIFPSIESPDVLSRLPEVLDVPGVRVVSLSMGDLSRALGFYDDWDRAEFDPVARAIALAHERGVRVMANIPRRRQGDDDTAVQAAALHRVGADVLFVQPAEFLLQRALEWTLTAISDSVGGGKR